MFYKSSRGIAVVEMDTVVWLYEGDLQLFPDAALDLLGTEPIVISPMVRLEVALLHEIKRIAPPPDVLLADLGRSVGLTESRAPFAAVVDAAAALDWTRDPFDRLICAQAIVDGAVLLTKDRRIRSHLDRARWD